MAEGVGVSDQQLDETGLRAIEGSDHMRMAGQFGHDPDGWFRGTVRELVGEVRASHAREAEQADGLDRWEGVAAAAIARKVVAEAERDVLQQRIDKALELTEYERDNLLALLKAVSGWGGPSVLSAANTGDWVMQVAGKLNPGGPAEGDWGRPNVSAEGIVRAVNERVATARAALTGTGDTE